MILKFLKIIDQKILFGKIHNIFQKIRTLKSLRDLSKIEYSYKSFYEKKTLRLSKLCDIYEVDKGYNNFDKRKFHNDLPPHTYTDFYSSLFDHCRLHVKNFFECGIGSNDPKTPSNMGTNYQPGASLRMWRDYFENANIYGADVDKKILFTDERIKTFYVDQLKKETILAMWNKISEFNFDLIVDDGLHSFEACINLFDNSFERLRSDGIYIIEDVDMPYLSKLFNYLKKYNPEVIVLKSKYKKIIRDNNLIMIRKI